MRYGFIGCGNMGGAVARAVCRGVGPENVVLANRTPPRLKPWPKHLAAAPPPTMWSRRTAM